MNKTAVIDVTTPVDTILDSDGHCPSCTLKAVNLDIDGRYWWMTTYGISDKHLPGCNNEGVTPLARLRFAWLRLQALRHPNRPCAPMPHDPQPEFWHTRPPAPVREYSGPSPYQRIKSALSTRDICDMLGVKLSRWGTLERGLCPLHKETTPSFTVYPEDRGWYCFGCGKGGDQITLLEEAGQLADFIGAVR